MVFWWNFDRLVVIFHRDLHQDFIEVTAKKMFWTFWVRSWLARCAGDAEVVSSTPTWDINIFQFNFWFSLLN